MDYGKLAYLKVTDLESRISIGSGIGLGVKCSEYSNVPSGKIEIVRIEGSGEMAVFVDSTDEAAFYYNNLKVGSGTKFFFKVDGGGSLSSESGGIGKLRILVLGNLNSSESGGVLQADFGPSLLGYLLVEMGRVKAFSSPLSSFNPGLIFEGDYLHGDICAYEDGFIIAVTDGITISLVTTLGKTRSFPFGADKVAISSDGNVLTVAFTMRGKLYKFDLGNFDATMKNMQEIYFTGVVDDVKMIKKTGKAVFSSGGKCYVKDIGGRISGSDKMYINMEAEVI